MSLITVYSQPGCGPCVAVKTYLDRAGVGYSEVDIADDPGAAQAIRDLGYTGTPVVVAGDMHTHGFRREWLDRVVAAVRAERPEDNVDSVLAAIEQDAA